MTRPLTTVLGPYGHVQPIKDGRVGPVGVTLACVEVNPLVAAFRRMVRERAFDVCEVAITTYLVAKSFDCGFTALPIPLNHMLHFGDVQVGLDAGIDGPTDLAGRRVGVRAYTVTTGVWVRGILQSEYGVDPASITWYTDDEEHVTAFRPPTNVVPSSGASLVDLFQDGRIDAAFAGPAGLGRTGAPVAGWDRGNAARDAVHATRPYKPLFPDAAQLDADWVRRTGIYPIHGVVCVRDDVLAAQPELPRALLDAFTRSKELYLRELAEHGPQTADDKKWVRMQEIVGSDPLPYGIAPNRRTIEALIAFAHAQGLIPRRYAPEEVFAPL
jgi:4,5-dihydroxyphthalate decarboxylase